MVDESRTSFTLPARVPAQYSSSSGLVRSSALAISGLTATCVAPRLSATSQLRYGGDLELGDTLGAS